MADQVSPRSASSVEERVEPSDPAVGFVGFAGVLMLMVGILQAAHPLTRWRSDLALCRQVPRTMIVMKNPPHKGKETPRRRLGRSSSLVLAPQRSLDVGPGTPLPASQM